MTAKELARASGLSFVDVVSYLSQLWVLGQIKENLRVASGEYSFYF